MSIMGSITQEIEITISNLVNYKRKSVTHSYKRISFGDTGLIPMSITRHWEKDKRC
jgi:hypothetical protein